MRRSRKSIKQELLCACICTTFVLFSHGAREAFAQAPNPVPIENIQNTNVENVPLATPVVIPPTGSSDALELPSDTGAALTPAEVGTIQTNPSPNNPPEPVFTQLPALPTVVTGPAGSQLVGVQGAVSYTSPLGAYLGLAPRQSSDTELSRYFQSTSRRRVVDVPEMFGDFRRFTNVCNILNPNGIGFANVPTTSQIILDLPNAGGISGLKVAENNQAITANRVWFTYSRMDDARRVPNGANVNARALDRFAFGVERVFADGRWSLEARLPLSGSAISDDVFDAGTLGDLSIILKRLLYADQNRATAIGMGIELPTGDAGRFTTNNVTATLDSDTVHLVPYFATTQNLNDRVFGHLFAQLDVPLGEDDFTVGDFGLGAISTTIRQALTASVDIGAGYWLIKPCHPDDSGLALLAEAHYTSRLDSPDPIFAQGVTVSRTDRLPTDVLNLTTGVHAEFTNNWSLRSGISVPVTNDQLFDVEYLLQINRTL